MKRLSKSKIRHRLPGCRIRAAKERFCEEHIYTYIARSETDPHVIKIGKSASPEKRVKELGYEKRCEGFHFRLMALCDGNIEQDILWAVLLAGGEEIAEPGRKSHNRIEIFRMHEDDILHLSRSYGFKPIKRKKNGNA